MKFLVNGPAGPQPARYRGLSNGQGGYLSEPNISLRGWVAEPGRIADLETSARARNVHALASRLVSFWATVPTSEGPGVLGSRYVGEVEYVARETSLITASRPFVPGQWFSSTQDAASAWCLVRGNLTIGAGQVFTPPARKLFTVVYVTGNLVLDGEISMSCRGANHSGGIGSGGRVEPVDLDVYPNVRIPAYGGVGGKATIKITNGLDGQAGASGASIGGSGGGGSGASRYNYSYGPADAGSGAGAQGTVFSGGPGGGGVRAMSNVLATAGEWGGYGGPGVSDGAAGAMGGGAGNPPLTLPANGTSVPVASNPGGVGTGGTLIVIVEGTISGSGALTADGANGGNSANSSNASGGGSGGGVVVCLAGDGTAPSMHANGGAGGTVSYPGGVGGTGATTFALMN